MGTNPMWETLVYIMASFAMLNLLSTSVVVGFVICLGMKLYQAGKKTFFHGWGG